MAEYTFYTNPMSRGQIARWALHETKADYAQEIVDWANKPAKFLAANPMGKVPTIVHHHAGGAPDGSPMGHGVLGAVMPLMPGGSPVPVWTYYFRVPDIDTAASQIAASGGTLLQGPLEIPGGEYSLVGVDPQGAAFGLVGPRKS